MSTPDWLQPSSEPPKYDVELSDDAAAGNDSSNNRQQQFTAPEIENAPSVESSPTKSRFILFAHYGISLIFFVLFIVAAAYQGNDGSDSLLWLLFYALNAASVGLFFFFKSCFYSMQNCVEKPLLGYGAAMIIWSIVMLIIWSIKLSKAKSSDPGGDSNRFNDKQEKALEVTGAALCLIAGIYNIMVWKFCWKNKKQEEAS